MKLKECRLITAGYSNIVYGPITQALLEILKKRFEQVFLVQSSEGIDIGVDCIYLIMGGDFTYNNGEVIRYQMSRLHKKAKIILWHFERLPLPTGTSAIADNHFEMLKTNYDAYDMVCTYDEGMCQYLNDHGLSASLFHFGYHPSFSVVPEQSEKNIDVFFLGTINDRRKSVLDQISLVCNLVSSETACGSERTTLLSKAKIFLNIHYEDINLMNSLRIMQGLANKLFVLSEQIDFPRPYNNGEHLSWCDIDSIPEYVEFYLRNEEERERIAQAGHDYSISNVSLESSVNAMIDNIF